MFSRNEFSRWLGRAGTAGLRRLSPETSHEVGLRLMEHGLLAKLPVPALSRLDAALAVKVPGLGELQHPIGLAAGFDKDCRSPHSFVRMGLSFLEIGTVTPRPQAGNPKPRIFRQPEQLALINRMGFPGEGAGVVAGRLRALNWRHEAAPLGINVGKNKDTPPERAVDDYLQVVETFAQLGKFFVVNVSSPNTPGLRDLATPAFIDELAMALGPRLPQIWLKLDPDMPKAASQALIERMVDRGFQGVVLTNTHRVEWPEAGGQSGHPLSIASSVRLEWAHEVHRGRLPMIAVGGVLSGADILQKLIRGASAVEIYTALIYRGPWVVWDLLEELAAELKLRGFTRVEDAIGSFYEA